MSDISEITRLGKRHLQGQKVGNRDRFDALCEGYRELCAEGPELIDFASFVVGVEAFERVLAERSLDRQYDYERARKQAEVDYRIEQEDLEARDRFSREGDYETPLGDAIEGE